MLSRSVASVKFLMRRFWECCLCEVPDATLLGVLLRRLMLELQLALAQIVSK